MTGAVIGVIIGGYRIYLWSSGAIATENVDQRMVILQGLVMSLCCMLYSFGYILVKKKDGIG